MAKSLVTDSGTLYIPGGYSQYKVASNPSGLATTGVLMLVGEADAGPDYSLESDIELNAFGPDQMSDVLAKYKSGNLPDAFKAAIAAANDPDITGSFSACILVKTNVSGKATGTLTKVGGGTYATIADKSYGKLGDGIAFQVLQVQSEVLPTTGAFTYIPSVGALDYRIRVNGGAAVGTTAGANITSTAFVALVDALAGVAATGGASRSLITAAGGRSLTVVATGNSVVITTNVAWDNIPTAGDTFVLPSTAPANLRDPAGGSTDENVGAYVVTAATATTVSATKLSDAGRAGAVAGVITAPANVAVAVALAAATDVQAFAPVTITLEAGAAIDGVGKTLEIAELTSGADLLSRTAYVLGTTTAVSWVSKTSAPTLLTATEATVKLNTSQASASITESMTDIGGEIALKLGYLGTTATVTISDTTLATTVVGGSGTSLSLTLADFTTIQSLADYIASQTGYVCTVGTASLGLLPPSALDNVTAQTMCGQFAVAALRLKIDGYRFFEAVSSQSSLVQINNPAVQASAGLPAAMAAQQYLTGGTKGGTTDAQVSAAIAALENAQGNFLVPLFARNASVDIVNSKTDISSTYTIAAIHAAARSHVNAMSQLKRQKNRQAVLAINDTFATVKDTAANTANFRAAMAMGLWKQQSASTGSILTYDSWMGAVLAAGMQAAGFYKNIENKGINTNGVLGDTGFNPKNDTQVEQALKAGLLVARLSPGGGYRFVSDQTTYGVDNNFVFNSMQAVYAADTVALTMAKRMGTAFTGQSVADVSAPVARAFAENILADMLRLKLIAPSDDDAPKGWKNLSIKIRGNVMLVSVEIKLATAIDFIKIDFLVSQVEQSA